MDDELFWFAGGVITIGTTQITDVRGVIWTPYFRLAFTDTPMQVHTSYTGLLYKYRALVNNETL